MTQSNPPAGWTAGQDTAGPWALEPLTGQRFRALPAGTYRVGLSDAELTAARRIDRKPNITIEEMRPVITVAIPDLWVAELPVSVESALGLGIDPGSSEANHPAMLTHDEAVTVAARAGCRLPSEAEWETMCRAGTSSLFPFGWELPSEPELDDWLTWDLTTSTRNAWGFGGLFAGEWTADLWRPSHDAAAADEPGTYVVKGGGAQFWPWQDAGEWVWCLPSIRMPSTDLDVDGRCAARLVAR